MSTEYPLGVCCGRNGGHPLVDFIGRATETEGGGESDADACGSRPDRNDPLRYQRHLPRLGLGGGATRSRCQCDLGAAEVSVVLARSLSRQRSCTAARPLPIRHLNPVIRSPTWICVGRTRVVPSGGVAAYPVTVVVPAWPSGASSGARPSHPESRAESSAVAWNGAGWCAAFPCTPPTR